jgi:uncharacterized membrane protein
VGYFLPILIVVIKKLWHSTPFLLFACYWLLGGLVNSIDLMTLNSRTVEIVTVLYNSVDMPAVLAIFYFTTSSPSIKKFTRFAVPGLAAIGLINLAVRGMKYDSLKYTLAAGLLIVLVVIVWEIILYLQKIEHSGIERGLLFIYAALLFQYGTYIVIYIFDYFLRAVSSTIDNFIVYYISSLVALIIAICGFLTKGIEEKPRLWRNSNYDMTGKRYEI